MRALVLSMVLIRAYGMIRAMVYALFMVLVLLTFAAAWHRHPLQIPLFLLTIALVLLYLIQDMTTRLTLSF
jgi:hypothetical protein